MTWIGIVLIGHLLNAVSFVLDKVLLTKSIKNAYAFTFYIALLGLLVVCAAPFGFEMPTAGLTAINLAAGASFSAALLFFFFALGKSDASRVVPFIGGAIPVFTLVFELLFLDTRFTTMQLVAFAVLVVGTVVITIDDKAKKSQKTHTITWVHGILAALFFAVSFGLTKIAFNEQPFLSAFIWTRIGAFLFPVFFLFSSQLRHEIIGAARIFKEKSGILYLVAQAFGAAGFVFINYAISIASVSLVNAMQGVQYAFLLLIAVVGTLKYPNLLKESMTRKGLIMKIIAVGIIAAGLAMLALIS